LPFEEPENEAMISLVEQTSVVNQDEVIVLAEKQQNPKNEDPKNKDTKIENPKNELSEETHAGLSTHDQSQIVWPDTKLPPQLGNKSVTRQAADSTSHSERLHR